jgi:hypothetical protein
MPAVTKPAKVASELNSLTNPMIKTTPIRKPTTNRRSKRNWRRRRGSRMYRKVSLRHTSERMATAPSAKPIPITRISNDRNTSVDSRTIDLRHSM